MALNTFLDFSETAASNIDVGGISIQGTAPVSNFDGALRSYIAILRRDLDYGVVPVNKSAGYTAVANDNNGIIRFTAAATLALTAAATLGANWHVMIVANGGDVIIDPNASETIDGKTTLTVRDGSSVLVWCDGSNFRTDLGADPRVPKGHINGLTLANNATDATNDIDIAVGECASDGTIPYLMVLGTAITKRLDATWAVGTGNGGLDTGSIANTTYHVWLIQRSDTGVVDALFSTSATSPTMPSNYDRKRRIGSILRESAAIVAFNQNGDTFLRTEVVDYNATTALASTTLALSVPSGVVVRPIFVSKIIGNGTANAAVAYGPHARGSANLFVQSCGANTTDRTVVDKFATNTSRQIYIQVVIAGGALTEFNVTTIGWIDDRGKLS